MSSLVKTRRRINSVASTRKITNAMELVASVKFKRFKNALQSSDYYNAEIRNILSILTSLDNEVGETKNTIKDLPNLIIIINSSLGLCGSYNNDIFRFANEYIKPGDIILPIGTKGLKHYQNSNIKIDSRFSDLGDVISFLNIDDFAHKILSEYLDGKYQSIKIIYMKFKNSLTFIPTYSQLIPFTYKDSKKTYLLAPVVEPSPKELIDNLLPIYFSSSIYDSLLNSLVSEQASRRNAMENATNNADELLEKLTLEYNKARQGAITQEITEVVAGANNAS